MDYDSKDDDTDEVDDVDDDSNDDDTDAVDDVDDDSNTDDDTGGSPTATWQITTCMSQG